MIDYSVLPMFLAACFILVISPGPDLLLIGSYSSKQGVKSGAAITLGIFVAGILQTLLVAFGLAKLLTIIPMLSVALKLMGALYFLWLGLKLIKQWYVHEVASAPSLQSINKSDVQLFFIGMLNNILNPKALLFFALFLPQFTHNGTDIFLQILTLGCILSLIALLTNLALSQMFSLAGKKLANKFKIGRYVDGILGLLFITLAGRLAFSSEQGA
ncbi:hypothetical protein PCIT_b1025 [Pseudoalteromonas citrea]|uniref:LysE family translocator n=2 Tax=Pseudoalteromonas citrea TaxID=43655 RepID=A0AAD4AFD3_9GAMM|nr:LysE family translocator [Pseudoalteromonas citrea]KAF7764921.1 hypothetical protein PCIT_b1025 [Pseudoalteromonas citrea]